MNKPIAAVCHAAQILAAADVVRGKKSASAYPPSAPTSPRPVAPYVKSLHDGAIVDGQPRHRPAWPAHTAWLAKFLVVLGTRIEL